MASSLISKYINDMLPKLESTCLTTTDLMLKAQKESCNNSISIQKFSGFSRQSENTIYFAISKLLTFGKKNVSGRVRFRIRMGINFWDCIAQPRREIDKVWEIVWERGTLKIHAINPKLYLVNFDLVNIVVRPFLFTKLGLFTLIGSG